MKRTLFCASFKYESFYSLIDKINKLNFKERIKMFILNLCLLLK